MNKLSNTTLRTISGCWLRYNTFVTTKGENIKIYPYRPLGKYYWDLLPLDCYILLQGDVIKNVVEK